MSMLRRVLTVLGAAWVAVALPVRSVEGVVPGEYIITLKPGVALEEHLAWANDVHTRSTQRRESHSGVSHQYAVQGFNGYAGAFDDVTIDQIRSNENVASVEPNSIWRLFQAPLQPQIITEENATWGLGRISHETADSVEYIYDARAGAGTFAYVVDTGILTTHVEFGGRASVAYDATDSTPVDNVGHGTHVAGTIGSASYGVAKSTTLLSVKVLDSELGVASQVMDGYAWAVNNITAEGREAASVINLSLGGSYSQAFNDMIEAAFNAGITTVAAAGNFGELANLTSPASSPSAITVAAIARNSTRPDFSDYGATIDIFAPGVDVLSCFTGSDTATELLSGTSMSAPHVSGLVLYLKSIASGSDDMSSPAAVTAKIKALASPNLVENPGPESPNVIAYNGNGA